MNAQAIYNTQFRDCARSPEWKAGALRGLQKALGEPCPTGAPYDCGTAQDDAWRSGVQAGLTEGRMSKAARDAHGFSLAAKVIGDGYVPRPAAVPSRADSASRSAAEAIQPPHAQTPSHAMHLTTGGRQ